jgi:hypothetical protein
MDLEPFDIKQHLLAFHVAMGGETESSLGETVAEFGDVVFRGTLLFFSGPLALNSIHSFFMIPCSDEHDCLQRNVPIS